MDMVRQGFVKIDRLGCSVTTGVGDKYGKENDIDKDNYLTVDRAGNYLSCRYKCVVNFRL